MKTIILPKDKRKKLSLQIKCRGCGKSDKEIKFYILADDMENPKPYHPACLQKLMYEVLEKLSEAKI